MTFTTHFIDRYFERVLDCNKISQYSEAVSAVFTDMSDRFSIQQYMAYEHFVGNNINELGVGLFLRNLYESNQRKNVITRRFFKLDEPSLFLPGVFQVTHKGLNPYFSVVKTCHVLSFPPLTGITQS